MEKQNKSECPEPVALVSETWPRPRYFQEPPSRLPSVHVPNAHQVRRWQRMLNGKLWGRRGSGMPFGSIRLTIITVKHKAPPSRNRGAKDRRSRILDRTYSTGSRRGNLTPSESASPSDAPPPKTSHQMRVAIFEKFIRNLRMK